jgi:nickel-type superoxide dismutase maturation protease
MLPTSSLTTKLLFFLHLRKRHIVQGDSMSPLLHEGDIVYTKKTHDITVGDIVVVSHPFRNKNIIKQVTAVDGIMLELSGINANESEDSRTFGYVPIGDVIGVVVAKEE